MKARLHILFVCALLVGNFFKLVNELKIRFQFESSEKLSGCKADE